MIDHRQAGRAPHRFSPWRSLCIEMAANPIDAAGVLCIARQSFVAAIGEAA
jgi:hypothetical protein